MLAPNRDTKLAPLTLETASLDQSHANQISDPGRLASLRRTGLLDSPPEEAFDRFTRLAAQILGARVALVSLLDDKRQFYKSAVGLSDPLATERGAPLSHSYCKYVVESGEPLVVSDAREHPSLKNSPAIEDHEAISYCGVPIVDGEGRVFGTMCVMEGEPRAWTPSEVRALADIAQAVTNEVHLRLLAEDLRDKNSALRDLMAIASHDIRSPLAVIVSYARMLLDADEFGLSEPEKTEFLDTIKDEAERGARLVSDLLNVTKLEAGVEGARIQDVHLRTMVETEVTRSPHEGIAIKIDDGVTVAADPDDLRRIIALLVDNAFKYGAAPIKIECSPTELTASICVSDEGDGVPSGFVPRLFDKFARSPKSAGVSGSGLGLAIAAGLAARNGGCLRFEPNEPHGARFVVELPRVA